MTSPDWVGDLQRYWPLYAEAFRARRQGITTLPGRQRVTDDELRRYVDDVLAARPTCHCNGEHAVAVALRRLVCTGPRWHRVWTERVALRAIAQAPPEPGCANCGHGEACHTALGTACYVDGCRCDRFVAPDLPECSEDADLAGAGAALP